jgi:hypothetical protein
MVSDFFSEIRFHSQPLSFKENGKIPKLIWGLRIDFYVIKNG